MPQRTRALLPQARNPLRRRHLPNLTRRVLLPELYTTFSKKLAAAKD